MTFATNVSLAYLYRLLASVNSLVRAFNDEEDDGFDGGLDDFDLEDGDNFGLRAYSFSASDSWDDADDEEEEEEDDTLGGDGWDDDDEDEDDEEDDDDLVEDDEEEMDY